jgi:hypothetical protein
VSGRIEWPERYAPHRVAARVSNEISMDAGPEVVWICLIRAAAWPDWYPNSADVRIDGGGPDLSAGVAFTWRTFGVTVHSRVRQFEPPFRIAWEGHAFALDIYHAWLIEPHRGGSWVLTEEHQNGVAARVQSIFMPRRMYRGHALWLDRLKARTEKEALLF